MKKITSQKLSKRLAKYGALSVAIAGVADVNGQIIYTDVTPDAGGLQIIDVDNDGGGDFVINQFSGPDAVRGYPISAGSSSNLVGNAILGSSVGGFNYPSNLSSGQVISSAGPWNSAYAFNDFCYAGGYANSQFCGGVTDAFIGLRFDIGGNYHYGWARLDVASSASFLLKDFAYESTAGVAITAGDTGVLGLDDNYLNKIKIVALNKSIALFNLPQETNYTLFSITGKSVLNGKMDNNTHVIKANSLATGVYIIELKNSNTNAVIRKKIVL